VAARRQQAIVLGDIFYYVYGVLHRPDYREKFTDNLKRELPRIPLAPPGDQNRACEEAARREHRAHKGAALAQSD
jgi:predicted helicase